MGTSMPLPLTSAKRPGASERSERRARLGAQRLASNTGAKRRTYRSARNEREPRTERSEGRAGGYPAFPNFMLS